MEQGERVGGDSSGAAALLAAWRMNRLAAGVVASEAMARARGGGGERRGWREGREGRGEAKARWTSFNLKPLFESTVTWFLAWTCSLFSNKFTFFFSNVFFLQKYDFFHQMIAHSFISSHEIKSEV